MAEYKPVRKRNVEMSLPEHHESSLSVAMSGKPALPTKVCSPGRMIFASACRAVTTGAFLVCQARCNTGFVSLVAQIPLDCPEFHLGDLLARLPAETSLFLRIFLYAGGISDDQFGNVVGDTEIYRLTGSLVQQVPHPAVRGGLHPPLGGNQLSPSPASFLAAGKGIREPSQGFVPESFDGTHFSPGYDKTATLFVTDGNGMDFTDVGAGTDAQLRIYRPLRHRISHVLMLAGGTNPVSNDTPAARLRTSVPFSPVRMAICLNGMVRNFFSLQG